MFCIHIDEWVDVAPTVVVKGVNAAPTAVAKEARFAGGCWHSIHLPVV